MIIKSGNKERFAEVGYIKEIKEKSVIFITRNSEIEIMAAPSIIEQVREIQDDVEDALIPLDTKNKQILLNSEIIY